MSEEQTGFKEINEQKIYYRIKGNGPPMVFVHGWTLNLSYWDKQVDYFSENFTTYSYDWRGMGKSTGATPAFSMIDLGEELGAFIKAFDIENPILCGHSEGGAIVARYAVDNPTSIRSMILADTSLNTMANAVEGVIGFAFTKFFQKTQELLGKNYLEEMMPGIQKQLYAEDFIENNPEYIAAWQKQFLSNSVDAVINGLGAWEYRKNLDEKIEGIEAPCLLLWGLEDVMIKLSDMQTIQEQLTKRSQLSTLEGSGHMTPVEVPDRFNRAIHEFLKSKVFQFS